MFAQVEVKTWLDIADRYGVPTAMLVVTLVFFFICVRWIANHIAIPLVDSHKELIQHLKASNESNNHLNTANASVLSDLKKEQSAKFDALTRKQDKLIEGQQEVAKAINNQTRDLCSVFAKAQN